MRKLTSGFTLTSDVILRLPLTSDDFASRFNWSLKSSRTSLSRTSSSICWLFPEEESLWRLWSRQIHRSSKCSRCSWDLESPVCNIITFISPSEWSLWKCSAISELSGRCLISCRCLLKRLARELPVWPTQTNSCRVHMAAYIKLVVWQFPPFSAYKSSRNPLNHHENFRNPGNRLFLPLVAK